MTAIAFRIYPAELADIGVTAEQCVVYCDRLHDAIVARYPGAVVDVEAVANVTGYGSGPRVVSGPDDDCDEGAVRDDVREIADRVLSDIVNA